MKTIFDELQQEVKNWWISLILGILYVIVAISLMFSPLSGYAVLSILFSISLVVLKCAFGRGAGWASSPCPMVRLIIAP